MASVQELKNRVCAEIDRHRDELIGIAETILHQPELGFKEFETARLVANQFAKVGLSYREGLAITGVRANLEGGGPGPTVAVLGELDSLAVFDHPLANPTTGAAHACGHNAQIGMMLGVGMGLLGSGVLGDLSGRVALFAVPAEEYVEVEYRLNLRRQGKLEFLGGKPELIRLGEMDDVDMAMMIHNTAQPRERKFCMGGTSTGCVVKQIQFLGKAAHAGGAPDRGINALNAAMVALMAIHAQRETFRDDDTVRVHPIITRGGDLVNVVPADVRMETFVRGKTIEAIMDADTKVDRALRAGAIAVGAQVRITTVPGYMPVENNAPMTEIMRRNAVALVSADEVTGPFHRTGSTDMGDLTQIMPAIHPYAGGAEGVGHGNDYRIADYDLALMNPAKAMAMTVIDLLAEGATGAKSVLAQSKPRLTKEEYLAVQRQINRETVES